MPCRGSCNGVCATRHANASIAIVYRTYFVGGALAAGDPGGQQRWCLPDAVDRMYAAYCGTLTAEIDHLASQ